ncbi:type II toxin-antitoxin system RelE/ParE family toxin [Actinobacillus equuli]|uniref:type II toxin-antitoxin system RelE/ParE family toxin n=1 Tax=Actinobacillus equuli TaxID=718 RepID=UPI0024410A12|nr:type II toxin-antitoxin system RelE/ParE family toxin [Actinobacillus equuli]WGE85335.1 type II toxin-antitoxin system RelE/ParE family toxin [Actinobacillus equuli subsp. haemolyticus]
MQAKIFIIEQTQIFKYWLKTLKNPIARITIARRIERANFGNFGDHKALGAGLWEMRIDTGAGYRVYYAQKGECIYLLLSGGDKSSQAKDIEKARTIWTEIQKHQ